MNTETSIMINGFITTAEFSKVGFVPIRLVGGPLGGLDFRVPEGVIPGDVLRLHTALEGDGKYRVVFGTRQQIEGVPTSRTLAYRQIYRTNAYLFEGME